MKKQFKIRGMHCTSCALLIESDLEDAGARAKCSYAKQVVEVEFETDKLTEQKIKDIIKASGYTASE